MFGIGVNWKKRFYEERERRRRADRALIWSQEREKALHAVARKRGFERAAARAVMESTAAAMARIQAEQRP